jgi:hypothetical protein
VEGTEARQSRGSDGVHWGGAGRNELSLLGRGSDVVCVRILRRIAYANIQSRWIFFAKQVTAALARWGWRSDYLAILLYSGEYTSNGHVEEGRT